MRHLTHDNAAVNWYEVEYCVLCHVCRRFVPIFIGKWDIVDGEIFQLVGQGKVIFNCQERWFVCQQCQVVIYPFYPHGVIQRIKEETHLDLFDDPELIRLSLFYKRYRNGFIPSNEFKELAGEFDKIFIEYIKKGYIPVSRLIEIRKQAETEIGGYEGLQKRLFRYADALEWIGKSHTWIVPDTFVEHVHIQSGWWQKTNALVDACRKQKAYVETTPIIFIS